MIIININDAGRSCKFTISCIKHENRINLIVHQINPKKFREIKNKAIPSTLRPKFRQKAQTNIYFLSQRKFNGERKNKLIKNIRFFSVLSIILVGGYFLTN